MRLRYAGGITYLWALLAVALMGGALAAVAPIWTTAAQREREAELLFIGEQFRRAIGSYYEASPGPVKRYPATLADLLEDRRYPTTRRHLRRIYIDPMTRDTDWGVVLAADKTVMGVYSKARGSPFRRSIPASVTPGGQGFGAWQFIYAPQGVLVGANPTDQGMSQSPLTPSDTPLRPARPPR